MEHDTLETILEQLSTKTRIVFLQAYRFQDVTARFQDVTAEVHEIRRLLEQRQKSGGGRILAWAKGVLSYASETASKIRID